jgi:hypothetical protein
LADRISLAIETAGSRNAMEKTEYIKIKRNMSDELRSSYVPEKNANVIKQQEITHKITKILQKKFFVLKANLIEAITLFIIYAHLGYCLIGQKINHIPGIAIHNFGNFEKHR